MEVVSIHIFQKIEKHLVKIEGNIGKIDQKQKKGEEGIWGILMLIHLYLQ